METLINAPTDIRQLVLSLIKDDLINSRLVNTLNDIGIDASDYNLHICETVFRLMGFEQSIQNDPIMEHYFDLTTHSKSIDFVKEPLALNELALKIYLYLESSKPL